MRHEIVVLNYLKSLNVNRYFVSANKTLKETSKKNKYRPDIIYYSKYMKRYIIVEKIK